MIPANSHLLVYTDERLEGGGGAQGYQAQPNGHQDDAGDWPPGDHGVTGHGQWSPVVTSVRKTNRSRERAVRKQPPQLTPGSEAAVDENRGQGPRSASLSWPDPWQSEDTVNNEQVKHNNIIITVSRSLKRYIQILCQLTRRSILCSDCMTEYVLL